MSAIWACENWTNKVGGLLQILQPWQKQLDIWTNVCSTWTWLVTNRPIHIDSDGHDDEKLGGAASAASEQTDLSS